MRFRRSVTSSVADTALKNGRSARRTSTGVPLGPGTQEFRECEPLPLTCAAFSIDPDTLTTEQLAGAQRVDGADAAADERIRHFAFDG
jgi:hypothetical protein